MKTKKMTIREALIFCLEETDMYEAIVNACHMSNPEYRRLRKKLAAARKVAGLKPKRYQWTYFA